MVLIVTVWLAGGLSQTIHAKTCSETVAKVHSVQGRVERLTLDEPIWTPVDLDEVFCPGDQVRVGRHSRASLTLNDDTLLRLAENSSVTINAPEADGGTWLDLLEGVAHFISRVRRNFQVKTPYVNACIEGTEFTVETASNQATITVLEGRVRATNDYGEVVLKGGQKAVALTNQAPRIEQVVDPLDAVQWTLYYPPLTENDSAAGRQSIEAYRRGDLEGAFGALAQSAAVERDPALLVYRASLHLRVGGVDAARRDLEQALGLDPARAEALALLSIIATVQNQRREALELARRSVEADPQKLSSLLALSYARQALFELPEALEAARQATEAVPESALAWSQLARLHLMFRHLDEATEAARRAVAIAPERSQPLTTLGFVHLAGLHIDAARQAFEQAIRLDRSAAPLPRFGLGLVEIRKGHLAEGRRQLEIAANLDPGSAMIRSYLGKAYYEEKRNRRAATQFDLAKQFDENDPTACFYNAILQQSVNRPVEALDELQASIDLNDNRAVYRSRFLLDQDEAARNASQARVYRDLGFEQLARNEAYKSLQTNPQNHSAHRLLSDSYSGRARYEKARLSELLQSQLLQPLNSNPIQPQLVASGLGILDGAGPSASGFSEYTPLFTRNGLNLQLNAIGGNNGSAADDLILSGLKDRIAFSLGQFHYETDGWRENNDLRQDVYDAFLQGSLSPVTSIQFEYRHEDAESGDLRSVGFEPGDFNPNMRKSLVRKLGRIGFHHQFRPSSHLVTSAIYQDIEDTSTLFQESGFGQETQIMSDDRIARALELQLIQRLNGHTLTLGGGNYDEQHKVGSYYQSIPTGQVPRLIQTFTADIDPRFYNLYLYYQLPLPGPINMTLGLTHEDYKSYFVDSEQMNPKFGLTWDISENLTFRAAHLKNLVRPKYMELAVEQTQIAGFNQLFDEIGGAEIELSGLGVDVKLGNRLSAGVEFTRRDIENIPIPALGTTYIDLYGYRNMRQELSQAYLYWAASNRLSLSIVHEEDLYGIEESDILYGMMPETISTQNTHIGFNYHYPSGVSIEVEGTYINQEISTAGTTTQEHFWNIDTILGYRLPKRAGKIEFVVKNILDEKFSYYEVRFGGYLTNHFQPDRQLFARFTLDF